MDHAHLLLREHLQNLTVRIRPPEDQAHDIGIDESVDSKKIKQECERNELLARTRIIGPVSYYSIKNALNEANIFLQSLTF